MHYVYLIESVHDRQRHYVGQTQGPIPRTSYDSASHPARHTLNEFVMGDGGRPGGAGHYP